MTKTIQGQNVAETQAQKWRLYVQTERELPEQNVAFGRSKIAERWRLELLAKIDLIGEIQSYQKVGVAKNARRESEGLLTDE